MREIKKAKTHHFAIEELACKILGLDYEEIDADTEIIEEKLNEEFYIDLDTFQEIVNRLLPLIDVGSSELTGERYKGFADVENKMWLVKMEITKTPHNKV